jgi:hypothetical protein
MPSTIRRGISLPLSTGRRIAEGTASRDGGGHLISLSRAARVFEKLVRIFDAHDVATAQETVLQIVRLVGFRSARLYYLDYENRLVLERVSGKKLIEKKRTLPNGKIYLPTKKKHPASYLALEFGRPLLVQVNPDPDAPSNMIPKDNGDGIPHIVIPNDPLRSAFSLPKRREWIDFPLVVKVPQESRNGEATPTPFCFGKITLDSPTAGNRIRKDHYDLLEILLDPITSTMSLCGWFPGYTLPKQMGDGVPVFRSEADLNVLLDRILDHVCLSLNAKKCSLFWIQSPKVSESLATSQPEKLVLWRTNHRPLKDMELKGFYLKEQGLTGTVWKEGKPKFVPELKADSHWKAHLNDSSTHTSYVGAPIISADGTTRGVIRVPEGKRLLHPRDKDLLAYFAKTAIAPAIENSIQSHLTRAGQNLMVCFHEHLTRIRVSDPTPKTVSSKGPAAQPEAEQEDPTHLWDFALSSCEKMFGHVGKKVLIHSVSDDAFKMVRQSGALKIDPRYKDMLEFPRNLTSASHLVLKTNTPLLLTDLKNAEQVQAYFPLVRGARSAMVAPLCYGGHPFGAIAVVSSLYDLQAERDLPVLQGITQLCMTLREMRDILHSAQAAERHRVVELSAYQAKQPAILLHSHAKTILKCLEENRAPTREDILDLLHWSDWLYYAAERVTCSIEDFSPTIQPKPVSVGAFMQRLKRNGEKCLASANSKQIQLSFADPGVPEASIVEMDENQILTAFLALFENGIKAAPAQSEVRITADISANEFSLTVRDSGKGIPASHLEKVKEPRVRMPFEIGPDYPPGVGCGLTLADKIARMHGGRLVLKSDNGTFTEAIFTIPIKA